MFWETLGVFWAVVVLLFVIVMLITIAYTEVTRVRMEREVLTRQLAKLRRDDEVLPPRK